MSWKIGKQLKRWSTGSSKFGFKKMSGLNPLTKGLWDARKVYRGIRKGTMARNMAKILGMSAAPSSAGSVLSGSVYGPTGSIVGRY